MTLLPRLNVVFDFSDPPEFNSAARGSIFKHDDNDKTSKKEQGEQDETAGLNASDGRSAKTKKKKIETSPSFFFFFCDLCPEGWALHLSLSLSLSRLPPNPPSSSPQMTPSNNDWREGNYAVSINQSIKPRKKAWTGQAPKQTKGRGREQEGK